MALDRPSAWPLSAVVPYPRRPNFHRPTRPTLHVRPAFANGTDKKIAFSGFDGGWKWIIKYFNINILY
jgi:hypothetical protein